jgi:hypothetical protein
MQTGATRVDGQWIIGTGFLQAAHAKTYIVIRRLWTCIVIPWGTWSKEELRDYVEVGNAIC